MWGTSFQVVDQGSLRDFQNKMGYCCCLWLSLRGWKWSLMLNTPCILDTRLRMQTGSVSKGSSVWTSFQGTGRFYEAAKGGNQSIVLSICDSYEPQQWQHILYGYSSETHILGVFNSYLIELKANRKEITWYWKPTPLPRAGEIMDLRREPTAITLLNTLLTHNCFQNTYLYTHR